VDLGTATCISPSNTTYTPFGSAGNGYYRAFGGVSLSALANMNQLYRVCGGGIELSTELNQFNASGSVIVAPIPLASEIWGPAVYGGVGLDSSIASILTTLTTAQAGGNLFGSDGFLVTSSIEDLPNARRITLSELVGKPQVIKFGLFDEAVAAKWRSLVANSKIGSTITAGDMDINTGSAATSTAGSNDCYDMAGWGGVIVVYTGAPSTGTVLSVRHIVYT